MLQDCGLTADNLLKYLWRRYQVPVGGPIIGQFAEFDLPVIEPRPVEFREPAEAAALHAAIEALSVPMWLRDHAAVCPPGAPDAPRQGDRVVGPARATRFCGSCRADAAREIRKDQGPWDGSQ